jgi:fimbrial chaperone protein
MLRPDADVWLMREELFLRAMIQRNPYRWMAVMVNAAVVSLAISGGGAAGQTIAVVPVNIFFVPGQSTATLTVTNRGTEETAIQIRPYVWNQAEGNDQLDATRALIISPPIVSIAAGATQLVRLLLRQPAADKEATYRILLDQIPPPPKTGIVHVVFRLSIPIFSQPPKRAAPHVQFHVECADGEIYLVGTNDGSRHEVIRDIELSTSNGNKMKADARLSPYILAGATRRWHIAASGPLPSPDDTLKLTARADAGAIEQRVRVVAKP